MTNNTQLPAEAKWKLEETEGDDVLLTNGKITMATSNVEDDYLRAILVLLNNCGGDFHSENELETKLGVELHIVSYELEQYKAKCDRYEKVLKDIGEFQRANEYWDHMTVVCIKQIANEALSGEEEAKQKQFTFEEVDSMLMEFALLYHRNPHKDIANDAAEYLHDKTNQKEDKQ